MVTMAYSMAVSLTDQAAEGPWNSEFAVNIRFPTEAAWQHFKEQLQNGAREVKVVSLKGLLDGHSAHCRSMACIDLVSRVGALVCFLLAMFCHGKSHIDDTEEHRKWCNRSGIGFVLTMSFMILPSVYFSVKVLRGSL